MHILQVFASTGQEYSSIFSTITSLFIFLLILVIIVAIYYYWKIKMWRRIRDELLKEKPPSPEEQETLKRIVAKAKSHKSDDAQVKENLKDMDKL